MKSPNAGNDTIPQCATRLFQAFIVVLVFAGIPLALLHGNFAVYLAQADARDKFEREHRKRQL